MNKELLKEHINNFKKKIERDPEKYNQDLKERLDIVTLYQSFTKDKILAMTEENVYEYIAPLWAMLIWANKRYAVDKILSQNSLNNFRERLAELVWGDSDISERWNAFRSNITGMGPAMISEVLCKTHPNTFAIWNRRAFVGLNYLGIANLPIYDYQLNGERYKHICNVGLEIASELKKYGFKDYSLLAVDYFIWEELQVEDVLSHAITNRQVQRVHIETNQESTFVHNEIRDKLRDIGEWLGLSAEIERRVSEGSQVDVVWEATIGNMGRVIYVFEVQTKGSIDGLMMNLLKSLNNPAVQGVVAVSDKEQLGKIKNQAKDISAFRDKLKFWDYEEILKLHESMEFVNESINKLGLVPQSF